MSLPKGAQQVLLLTEGKYELRRHAPAWGNDYTEQWYLVTGDISHAPKLHTGSCNALLRRGLIAPYAEDSAQHQLTPAGLKVYEKLVPADPMTFWYVGTYSPEPIPHRDIIRETDNYVFHEGGGQESKVNRYGTFFPTWEGARNAIVTKSERAVASAQLKLAKAQAWLEKAQELPNDPPS